MPPAPTHAKNTGKVFWTTGLSGAGKTTISQLLHRRLIDNGREVVLLDGDVLRQIFGDDLGYSLNQRRIAAWRNVHLCKGISDQSIDVVCATISMFDEVRSWGRSNIPNYIEIYLRAPLSVLQERDNRGLYNPLSEGEVRNVPGLDLPWDEPKSSHLILDNFGDTTVEVIVDKIWSLNSTK
jgi:adenylylsulfate kinase-like enzyme